MVTKKASSQSRSMIYLNDDLFRRVEQQKYQREEEERSRSRRESGHHHGRSRVSDGFDYESRITGRSNYGTNFSLSSFSPSSPSPSPSSSSSLQYYSSKVDVATAFHDYGIDLCYCHRLYEDSIKSLQKAATLRESLLGKYHADTALTYFRIASILGASINVGSSSSSSSNSSNNNATSQSAGREGREHVHKFERRHAADGERIKKKRDCDDEDNDKSTAAHNIHNLQQALAVSRRELRITYELLGDKKAEKKDDEEPNEKKPKPRAARGKKHVDRRQSITNMRHEDDDDEDKGTTNTNFSK
mmetsp:Transcript_56518/g.137186  ORF Transcript_56518/g.137186 Transcript_56518/m.137186 type:complete len:302 (+) Transcript_56518:69-974(+)